MQVANLFHGAPEDASPQVMKILRDAVKEGSELVKAHAKKLNIRTFYRVDDISLRVEAPYLPFQNVLLTLG